MPRPPRLHVPGGFYHVTLRGNHRQRIFFRVAHRRVLECIVREAVQRYDARVHAYCWMTNHIHLLIEIGDIELGRIMLRIASRYARFIQARWATTGHLFERRYHAVLVDADAYLITLLRYIHQNPVKAGMVASVNAYRWSSHHVYVGARKQGWLTTAFALQIMGSTHNAAVRAYRRLIEEPVPDDEIVPHADDMRILGDDRFLQQQQPSTRRRTAQSLEALLAEACSKFSVDLERLQSSSKERAIAAARAWVAHQAVSSLGATISEVARCLRRHEASIRGLMRRHPPK